MKDLFKKYLANQCSPAEVQQLVAHFSDPGNETVLRQLIRQQLESADKAEEEENCQAVTQKTFVAIKKQMQVKQELQFYRMRPFRVAAAVVLLLGAALYIVIASSRPRKANQGMAVINNPAADIEPGSDKAILTLADGSTIVLDSTKNGSVAGQGNTEIIQKDGQLFYTAVGNTTTVLKNTISTPAGGQYQLTLSDGTKVWLNAASSLSFPANFTGKERTVELTGEGYFEVVKNVNMPFKVIAAGKQEVEVLGTHFNINSYANEPSINTTLLEGKIKVSAKNSVQVLAPGQQAQLTTNNEIILKKQVDTDEVTAWKNGKFIFQETGIQSVMRQIERWYNVEVSFSGPVTHDEFVGVISRDVNISQILKMLENTSTARFQINGRQVIVK